MMQRKPRPLPPVQRGAHVGKCLPRAHRRREARVTDSPAQSGPRRCHDTRHRPLAHLRSDAHHHMHRADLHAHPEPPACDAQRFQCAMHLARRQRQRHQKVGWGGGGALAEKRQQKPCPSLHDSARCPSSCTHTHAQHVCSAERGGKQAMSTATRPNGTCSHTNQAHQPERKCGVKVAPAIVAHAGGDAQVTGGGRGTTSQAGAEEVR